MKGKIVEAVAAAATYKSTRNVVEEAMSAAISSAYIEADEVWHQENLEDDEKRKKIDAILDPEEVKRRMLAARDEVRQNR